MKFDSTENFKIIAVTDPDNCSQYFPDRLSLLAESGVDAVILRAKNYSEEDYCRLANIASTIFDDRIVPRLILHDSLKAANETGVQYLHMSGSVIFNMSDRELDKISHFKEIGVSIHSKEEALRAVSIGADHLIFGHIYETKCKQGIPPRGIVSLKEIVNEVSVPVYAIGGINETNIGEIKKSGAAGACLMSLYMQHSDIGRLTKALMEIY